MKASLRLPWPSGRVAALTLGVIVVGTAVALVTAIGASAYPSPLSSAARAFENASGPSGAGFRFEVVQCQVQDARADGPRIPVLDAADPSRVIGETDHRYVNSVLARGAVAPGAFWMEMRWGPPTEETAADFDTAPTLWSVIYQPPNLWRNEGFGWYRADLSPGVGMDPLTAVKLPLALRNLTSISDLGTESLDGASVRHYRAMVDVADFPGVIASDGAAFTESPFPLDVWLDGSNRLVRLEATARNLNDQTYLLTVHTVVTFTWTAAGTVPQPLPTAGPDAHPLP